VIAVVIVNWNATAMSIGALRSAAGADDVLPVLVDNGSARDPTAEVVAAVPRAVVVRLPQNLGFAAGANAAVRAAIERGAEHVVLLNNDAVLEPGALPTLRTVADVAPSAILAPLIVHADRPDVVWSAGGRVLRPRMRTAHLGAGRPRTSFRSIRVVPWSTGCALWFAAATYAKVGPLDESYFLYLEDVDWCLRAARLGVPTLLVPDAVVRHAVSATVGTLAPSARRYYAYRNHYRFAFRNASPWGQALAALDLTWTLVKVAGRSVLFPAYRRDRTYHARTVAIAHVLRRRAGPAPALDDLPVLATSLLG
jgi:GT2 family glycosyltransferase